MKSAEGKPIWFCCSIEQTPHDTSVVDGVTYVTTVSAGMDKVRVDIGYDTIISSANEVAVMVTVRIWTLSIIMLFALFAVIVTVLAIGAIMCMEYATNAVTVTVSDIGAKIVRLAPIGPVL